MSSFSKSMFIAASLGVAGCQTVPQEPENIISQVDLKVESLQQTVSWDIEVIVSVKNTGNQWVLSLQWSVFNWWECGEEIKLLDVDKTSKIKCSFQDPLTNPILFWVDGKWEFDMAEIYKDVVLLKLSQ